MLKCWADVSGYKQFVGEKCWSFKVNGWGGYVLKEKFKLLKAELKEWHKKHISNLPGRISSLKACISLLDCKGEGDELNDLEVEELCALIDELHSLSRVLTSIYWQQSHLNWLCEGDANS